MNPAKMPSFEPDHEALGLPPIPDQGAVTRCKANLAALKVMSDRWSEGPKGMLTNPDAEIGGIIDTVILTGEWFVIFNDPNLDLLDGFKTRDDAIRAFLAAFDANT